MPAIDYALDFVCFVTWLTLLVLSGIFAFTSLIFCAPVMVLTWISKQLARAAETME